MQYFFYQPEYYLKFRCTGADCSYSCCDLWKVNWGKNEYDRLLAAENISDDLHGRIAKNILANKDEEHLYSVKLCEDGRCPFHNRDNDLCDIQKELGEEYLGDTCRNYPRQYLMIGNKVLRFCMSTCPAVMKILMHDKKAMKMEEILARNGMKEPVRYETPQKFAKAPLLRYRKEIIDFCSWLFTSCRSVETALLMGALAAKNISDSVKDGLSINIPPTLAYMKSEWSGKDPGIRADNVTTDYGAKCRFIYMLLHDLENMPFDINTLKNGDMIDEARYIEGREKFRASISNAGTALNNIAMNMFLNLFINLDLTEHTFFDFYIYYSLCVSAVMYLGYTAAYIGGNIEKDFIKAASVLCRRLIHSKDNEKQIFEHIKAFRTPEQLASVIQ